MYIILNEINIQNCMLSVSRSNVDIISAIKYELLEEISVNRALYLGNLSSSYYASFEYNKRIRSSNKTELMEILKNHCYIRSEYLKNKRSCVTTKIYRSTQSKI